MRLLLVEDNVPLAEELQQRLRREGYACDWLVDGRDAAQAGVAQAYDVAILDLGLPGRSGLEVLREWRSARLRLPVLVLTARNTWSDRIAGLEAGADDYLGKPFHPDELVLRLRALVRRSHGAEAAPELEVHGILLNEARQRARGLLGEVELTGAEFRLLRYLMLNPGRILSKSQLADHLYTQDSDRSDNLIEVQIRRLRLKLGQNVIETRRGQGYIFRGGMA